MSKSPAAFLDRDGTLIQDLHYLGDPERVRLLDGVAEALALLNGAGYVPVIVSNQSGVGRGLIADAAVHEVNARLRQLLLAADGQAEVRAFYHCPHAPEDGCDCRKPRAGLFLRAADEHALDLGRSVGFGDRDRDLEAARAAGCRDAFLVGEGTGRSLLAAVTEMLGHSHA
jgi:D-glycero-D-manno-heptose 1,7-bisphosphate phosphatase